MATDDDLKAEIERLRAENEALKKPARGQMLLCGGDQLETKLGEIELSKPGSLTLKVEGQRRQC